MRRPRSRASRGSRTSCAPTSPRRRPSWTSRRSLTMPPRKWSRKSAVARRNSAPPSPISTSDWSACVRSPESQPARPVTAAEDVAGLGRALDMLGCVVLGKTTQLRLCITCLLAGGHLLIEDIPGVGKTILAHGIARALGLSYQRIQFTSDLLPADIVGVSIYDREAGSFRF